MDPVSVIREQDVAMRHVAEFPGRRAYFAVLARGGYSGRVSVESNGSPGQLAAAFATLRRQAADVAV